MAHKKFALAFAGAPVQMDVEVGSREVAIILGNLIFTDQMVTKGIPGKLAKDAVILMQIVAAMSKDKVRGKLSL